MRGSRWMIGLLAVAANSANVAAAAECLSSATAVRQADPQAWPFWTLRAPGHEGSKCWYGGTRSTAHDDRQGIAIAQRTREVEAVVSRQETYGFASRPTSEVVAHKAMPSGLPDLPASFAERFSAAYWGSSDRERAETRPFASMYNPP
jgi:hypothetical protein